MNVLNWNNQLFINGKKVSNFSIRSIMGKERLEIDNGIHKKHITLVTGSLIEFKRRALEQGNFEFFGTKKQLDAILELQTEKKQSTPEAEKVG